MAGKGNQGRNIGRTGSPGWQPTDKSKAAGKTPPVASELTTAATAVTADPSYLQALDLLREKLPTLPHYVSDTEEQPYSFDVLPTMTADPQGEWLEDDTLQEALATVDPQHADTLRTVLQPLPRYVSDTEEQPYSHDILPTMTADPQGGWLEDSSVHAALNAHDPRYLALTPDEQRVVTLTQLGIPLEKAQAAIAANPTPPPAVVTPPPAPTAAAVSRALSNDFHRASQRGRGASTVGYSVTTAPVPQGYAPYIIVRYNISNDTVMETRLTEMQEHLTARGYRAEKHYIDGRLNSLHVTRP